MPTAAAAATETSHLNPSPVLTPSDGDTSFDIIHNFDKQHFWKCNLYMPSEVEAVRDILPLGASPWRWVEMDGIRRRHRRRQRHRRYRWRRRRPPARAPYCWTDTLFRTSAMGPSTPAY